MCKLQPHARVNGTTKTSSFIGEVLRSAALRLCLILNTANGKKIFGTTEI